MLRIFGDAEWPLYGVQVVALSRGGIKPHTVYAVITRLLRRGYIQSMKVHAGLRPAYRITPQGKRALNAIELLHQQGAPA